MLTCLRRENPLSAEPRGRKEPYCLKGSKLPPCIRGQQTGKSCLLECTGVHVGTAPRESNPEMFVNLSNLRVRDGDKQEG